MLAHNPAVLIDIWKRRSFGVRVRYEGQRLRTLHRYDPNLSLRMLDSSITSFSDAANT